MKVIQHSLDVFFSFDICWTLHQVASRATLQMQHVDREDSCVVTLKTQPFLAINGSLVEFSLCMNSKLPSLI